MNIFTFVVRYQHSLLLVVTCKLNFLVFPSHRSILRARQQRAWVHGPTRLMHTVPTWPIAMDGHRQENDTFAGTYMTWNRSYKHGLLSWVYAFLFNQVQSLLADLLPSHQFPSSPASHSKFALSHEIHDNLVFLLIS